MGDIYGLILAGGLARRMGGGDKAFVMLDGRPLIAHAIERLKPQTAGLLISANGDAARFAGFDAPVVADDIAGFAGPLAGVLAGLDWLARARPQATHMLSLPADTPFPPRDLVAGLDAARRRESALLACAASNGRLHPAVALWPVDLRHDLRRALVEEDLRKIGLLQSRYPLARVEWPAAPRDPFFNVNAPDDLAVAETLAQIED